MIKRFIAVACFVAVFLTSPGQANAALTCGTDTGPTVSDSRVAYAPTGVGNLGGGTWDGSPPYINHIGLRARAADVAVNYCTTVYYDWQRSDFNHWDARWVRDCVQDGVDVVNSWEDAPNTPQSYYIISMQRFQTCYAYYNLAPTSHGDCSPRPNDAPCNINNVIANTDTTYKSRSYYVQYGGGGLPLYYDGGQPWSPYT